MNRAISILSAATLLLLAACATGATAGTLDPLSIRFLQGTDLEQALTPATPESTPTRDIRVDIWADVDEEQAMSRGEEFTLSFGTNADLYVVIYKINVEGLVEVIWPERRYSDGFVYGNHTYSIPRPGQSGRLRVGNVKGVEYIEAIASSYPFDLRALGIDFRFDNDDYKRHGYYIDGDPFLAVNDINYAITGLEEDVDYVVTDWMHLYVEEQVEYARYSCNQCHLDNSGYATVTPYVDTCTQVQVRADWGWHRGWYASFGWYPLYYEPSFYYWDYRWSRPYWYAWYPVPYRWPAYSCYTRPYPVYWWSGSGYYQGDYASAWSNKRTRSVPLYDVQRTRSRSSEIVASDGTRRTMVDRPVSVRGGGDTATRRVSEDRLVRNSTPPRQVDRPATTTRRGATGTITDPGDTRRGSIRTGRDVSERIVSQRPANQPGVSGRGQSQGQSQSRGSDGGVRQGRDQSGGSSVDRGRSAAEGRRWTRPRVQNEQPGVRSGSGSSGDRSPSSRSGVNTSGSRNRSSADRSSGRSSGSSSGRSSGVDRSRDQRSRSSSPPPKVRQGSSGSRSGGGGAAAKPAPRSQSKPRPAPSSGSSRGGGSSRRGGGRG
ncbi:hypothetical protein DRQ53_02690 [bacterium]|nr:MAG: hypothetical protein DRQ32_01860 [bacterium]RKZ17715.1 MAG: hypothetical protein DRQ53_02690 [bacterium]